jgi:hypothetical protein
MARIRLKLDIDMRAFEDDIVAAVAKRVAGAEEGAVREAVREVLAEDMVVAEMCGRRIFCAEVEAYEPFEPSETCEEAK